LFGVATAENASVRADKGLLGCIFSLILMVKVDATHTEHHPTVFVEQLSEDRAGRVGVGCWRAAGSFVCLSVSPKPFGNLTRLGGWPVGYYRPTTASGLVGTAVARPAWARPGGAPPRMANSAKRMNDEIVDEVAPEQSAEAEGAASEVADITNESLRARTGVHTRAAHVRMASGVRRLEAWSGRADDALDRAGRQTLAAGALLSRRGGINETARVWRHVQRSGRYLYRRRHAVRVGQESVAAYRQLGDRRREALELNTLGRAYRDRGEHQEAIVCYTQALGIFQLLGNRRGECLSLSNLGLAHDAQGNRPKAVHCYEQALDIARLLGDRQIEGQILANLATTYRRQGRGHEARDLWEQALGLLTPGTAAHHELAEHLGHDA
jgi:tetratricopeptide (TPR) repeat protein